MQHSPRGRQHHGLTPLRRVLDNTGMGNKSPPILAGKEYAAASVFEPANLLREARRQKGLAPAAIPEICLLDPDGDIVRWLVGAVEVCDNV